MKDYPIKQNPYSIVIDFEERIAEWAGSKYAVAVESGTAAIFLSLMYRKQHFGSIGEIDIPKFTYPSIPCSIIHAGGSVSFTNEEWEGEYHLDPLGIFDSALRFRKNMYHSGNWPSSILQCLSFHIKKLLPIGRGGMILTDDFEAVKWLRKARFDGRDPIPLREDDFTVLGWNMYMEPTQAARGIQLFETIRNKELSDLRVEDQGYPDLSKFPVYTQ